MDVQAVLQGRAPVVEGAFVEFDGSARSKVENSFA